MPRFRADHVGSLIRPLRLRQAREEWKAGRLSNAALKEIEDECIIDVVALQERVGLQPITDGEFRRENWMEGFFNAVEGYGERTVAGSFEFRPDTNAKSASGRTWPPAMWPRVESKLKRRRPMVTDAFEFLRKQTSRTAKVTLVSPSQTHLQGGDSTLNKAVYPDRQALMDDITSIYRQEIAELAAKGCTYLQIDDVALAVLCDPENQEKVRRRGEDPEENIAFYIRSINDAVRGRPAGITVNVHMCRGNLDAGMASGGYDPIAERAFSDLDVDGYLLEYDTPRAGDFNPLRFVPKGTVVALGLISTKRPELESMDELKRRVEAAAKFVDIDMLCLCTQCGFASAFATDRFTTDMMERKLEHMVKAADVIWG